MSLAKRIWLVALLLWLPPRARADVAVLLEEPYSYDGALAGTGHAALYLTRVCATSPTTLRRCEPGEPGVVMSRYHRIAGYDWIAIPLYPYLYAVDRPEDIPLFADNKLEAALRDQYRRKYLEDVVSDGPSRATPSGDWYELISTVSRSRQPHNRMMSSSRATTRDPIMNRTNSFPEIVPILCAMPSTSTTRKQRSAA
jgi:hypothetical protein